ncbi:unnamed protein product [Boreogadus saida]
MVLMKKQTLHTNPVLSAFSKFRPNRARLPDTGTFTLTKTSTPSPTPPTPRSSLLARSLPPQPASYQPQQLQSSSLSFQGPEAMALKGRGLLAGYLSSKRCPTCCSLPDTGPNSLNSSSHLNVSPASSRNLLTTSRSLLATSSLLATNSSLLPTAASYLPAAAY